MILPEAWVRETWQEGESIPEVIDHDGKRFYTSSSSSAIATCAAALVWRVSIASTIAPMMSANAYLRGEMRHYDGARAKGVALEFEEAIPQVGYREDKHSMRRSRKTAVSGQIQAGGRIRCLASSLTSFVGPLWPKLAVPLPRTYPVSFITTSPLHFPIEMSHSTLNSVFKSHLYFVFFSTWDWSRPNIACTEMAANEEQNSALDPMKEPDRGLQYLRTILKRIERHIIQRVSAYLSQ